MWWHFSVPFHDGKTEVHAWVDAETLDAAGDRLIRDDPVWLYNEPRFRGCEEPAGDAPVQFKGVVFDTRPASEGGDPVDMTLLQKRKKAEERRRTIDRALTAKDIVEHLSALPPDTPIVIRDADTDGLLALSSCRTNGEFVILGGQYGDEV